MKKMIIAAVLGLFSLAANAQVRAHISIGTPPPPRPGVTIYRTPDVEPWYGYYGHDRNYPYRMGYMHNQGDHGGWHRGNWHDNGRGRGHYDNGYHNGYYNGNRDNNGYHNGYNNGNRDDNDYHNRHR